VIGINNAIIMARRASASPSLPTPPFRRRRDRAPRRVRRAYIGVGAATTTIPRRVGLRLGLEQANGAG